MSYLTSDAAEAASRAPRTPEPMDVRIKTAVEFTISGSSLEDALAEYDEITVTGLLKEILDKAIACDEIRVELVDGPNTLEEYDAKQQQAS
jgi:hypothetical protein